MRSSYSEEDVILLLKDITGLVEPQPAKVREKLIQSGKHYSEMLPVEYVPTDQYMQVYHNALKHYAKPVANAVGMLADKIIENKGKKMVLVSLARAGIPIGILVKRYIKFKYGINVPHYSISIIRRRCDFIIEGYYRVGRTSACQSAGETDSVRKTLQRDAAC